MSCHDYSPVDTLKVASLSLQFSKASFKKIPFTQKLFISYHAFKRDIIKCVFFFCCLNKREETKKEYSFEMKKKNMNDS